MREWIVETAINIYAFLLPFSSIALAIALVVLLPLAAWSKTMRSRQASCRALHHPFEIQ
jgi:hypothetical protein